MFTGIRDYIRIFKQARRYKKMFQVEYKMKSDIDSKYFAYATYEELHRNNQLEFVNDMSGGVLTLQMEDLSYFITTPLRIDEN